MLGTPSNPPPQGSWRFKGKPKAVCPGCKLPLHPGTPRSHCWLALTHTMGAAWSSCLGALETNPTRNHEVAGSIPGLAHQVKDQVLLWR